MPVLVSRKQPVPYLQHNTLVLAAKQLTSYWLKTDVLVYRAQIMLGVITDFPILKQHTG